MTKPALREAPVEILLPGFITATANIQGGVPCLDETRIPTHVGLGWVWESLDNAAMRRQEGLTREQIIALAAFDAGYQWHRQRSRRRAFQEACDAWWRDWLEANP